LDVNLEKIPDDPAECKRIIKELLSQLMSEREENEELRQRLQLFLREKFGRKSESLTPGQLRLFMEAADGSLDALGEDIAAEEAPSPRSHGRRKPAVDLLRERRVVDVSESERVCSGCGKERVQIGEEVSEQYDYVPSSIRVIEHVRVKLACKDCEKSVTIAAVPTKPIAKGLATAGMIAHVGVSKYADHLPLHRQEGIFRRQGAEISRSTMCDWLAQTASILEPLYLLQKSRVMGGKVIWCDDTPVKVQDRSRDRNIKEGRIWIYRGDGANPYSVFDYTESRSRDGPLNFLAGYTGFLQADAFAGFDCIYADRKVKECACMAHVRRKFYDALPSSKKPASEAIDFIQQLYKVESLAVDLSSSERRQLRLAVSKPILDDFKKWLDLQVVVALPKSQIAKAVKYALNNWNALNTFLEDGDLTIDNNWAENELRRIAIGRKNWLFAGSDKGGRTAAIWVTLIAGCKRNKIDPFWYLRDAIDRLAANPNCDLQALLPDKWAMEQKITV